MSKQTLIDIISEENNIPKTQADLAIKMVIDGIAQAMTSGKEINLLGFGKFNIGVRAARTGRNPQTGAEMQIPESKNVRFKASKKLKELVNN